MVAFHFIFHYNLGSYSEAIRELLIASIVITGTFVSPWCDALLQQLGGIAGSPNDIL